jgi:integrase/recombinase XerC
VLNKKLVDFFLDNIRYERRLSPHTVLAYKTDLHQFETFIFKEFETEDCSKASFPEVRAWIVFLSDQKVSARTINRKIASIKAFFSYLLRQKKIETDPTLKVKALKTKTRPPEFVEERAIISLFDSIDFPKGFIGKRDRLILILFYCSGIRLAELIGLKLNEFDVNESKFKVLGKRNKYRVIPLPNSILPMVKDYLTERSKQNIVSEFFFTKPDSDQLYPVLVQRTVKKYLSLVTSQKKNSPHILRHTYATHLLNNGADLNAIKDLLGHTSLSATQVYTHNNIDKLKEVHKKAHPKS